MPHTNTIRLELGYSPPGPRSCTPLPAFLVLLTSPAVAGLRWSGLGQDSDGELPALRRGLTGIGLFFLDLNVVMCVKCDHSKCKMVSTAAVDDGHFARSEIYGYVSV